MMTYCGEDNCRCLILWKKTLYKIRKFHHSANTDRQIAALVISLSFAGLPTPWFRTPPCLRKDDNSRDQTKAPLTFKRLVVTIYTVHFIAS
jgi:hypothetical protein